MFLGQNHINLIQDKLCYSERNSKIFKIRSHNVLVSI